MKDINLNELYDYYKLLLTTKEQTYYEAYYFNDLSLMEISHHYQVSRNAIHNSLVTTEQKLKNYEQKLQLSAKKHKIDVIIEKLDKDTKQKIDKLI